MKKVLLTISILMLIMGGYGETKTVYADDWSTSIPDIDLTEGYTVYGTPNYDLYSAQYSNNQGVQALALARFKYKYAGKVTDYTYNSGNMTEITTTIWNLYIETYALGDSLSTTTNADGTSKLKIIADNNVFSSLSIACRSKNWGGGSQTVVTSGQYVGVGGNGYEILNVQTDNTEMGSPKYTTIPISSDYNLKRLKTSKSIVIQIDENINEYYIGTFYVKSRTVQRDANGNVTKWSFLMPGIDVDGNNPDQDTIYYSMQNDADPLYITYLKKGTEVYITESQMEQLQGGGSGGSGGGGLTNEQYEELIDTINNPLYTVDVLDKLDQIIELLGESIDTTTAEQIQDKAEEVNQATSEAVQQESQYTEDMQSQIDNINVNNYTGILSNGKFVSTMNWIRQVHLNTVENTELGGVVSLILIVGLAVYLIGRRSG